MEPVSYPGDSKLEFISGYEKKPLYTNLDVGYPVTKLPCTAKRSFLTIMAILFIIFVIALTAALSRSGCKCASRSGLFVSDPNFEPIHGFDDDASFPWDRFRLPDTLVPTRYHILIKPDWHNLSPEGKVRNFKGQIQIYMDVARATDSIILNAKELDIKHSSLYQLTHDGALGDRIPIGAITYDHERLEMVHFALSGPRALTPGQKLVLNLTYSGQVSKSLNGLYGSTYTDSKGEKHYLLSTQFEPNYARRVFPCFDEPAFKATFQISLVRPENLKSLSNMPLLSSKVYPTGNSGNRVKLYLDGFEASVVMSSYLVAFVICDFSYVSSKTLTGTLVSVYTPPEQIDQANFALKVAVDSLNFYEDFFGIKFPLPKMDLIAIPDFSVGAMENWGLVTYRMVDLLYKPNVTSETAKQRVAIVVAHELAHQWFGNLVTMAWWNDLWLNEGFATYMEYVCTDHIFPDWHMLDQFSSDTAPTAFALDALDSSHPVSHDIEDPNSIQAMFDSISYNKGALVLRMLDGPVMPRTSFKKGLHGYLTKYAFQNAQSQDLWHALQDAWNADRIQASKPLTLSHIDLESFMSGWITQKGFPLVTTTDASSPDTSAEPVIQLYQTKFVSQYATPSTTPALSKRRSVEYLDFEGADGLFRKRRDTEPRFDEGDVSTYTWQIPFTMLVGTTGPSRPVKTESVWLKYGNSSFTIGSPIEAQNLWVKGNVDYAGYYLVNYGTKGWANLNQYLRADPNSISALNKVQLIDNAFFLDKFGYKTAVDALNFFTYVNPTAFDGPPKNQGLKEKEPIPLISLIASLTSLRFKFRGDDATYDKLWPNFINKLLLSDLAHTYDWRKDLPHLESFLQSNVISTAVSLGNEDAINKARPLFKEMIYEHNNSRDFLPFPDLTSAILTAGIKYGTTEDWETAWEAYQASNVPSEKVEILSALGTTRDPNLLSKLLQYTLNPDKIRTQDMYIVLSRVATNALGGSQLAWEFLRSQWTVIEERFGDSSSALGNLIKAVCKTFDKPAQAREFEDFVKVHSAQLPVLAVNQTRETIQLNLAWLSLNAESVKAWLKDHQ